MSFLFAATGAVPTTTFTTATSLSVTALTAAVTDNATSACQGNELTDYCPWSRYCLELKCSGIQVYCRTMVRYKW